MKRFKLTLRARIFMSMILIILISFFLTGMIYFYHFKMENERYHHERLRRKEFAVLESINFLLREETSSVHADSLVGMFDTEICKLSKINTMDINIFSMNGGLLISSNPELFDKNVLNDTLHKSILSSIQSAHEPLLVKSDNYGTKYLSTYDYIRNNEGKAIAIINLPYFETEDVHRQDTENFLIRLSQIYLLLGIVSTFIAYLLSNYITGSLNAVGQKLKNIKINEPNPPLKWKFDDEIGTLVDEYNRMLAALEKSAIKLAKQERESAWQEMAKQVAHEIKNPLTPMRLNVQYLEKTLKCENPEKLHEFTESMISQIDTLSSIAEAFSRFASMPKLNFEKFPAKEIIQRTTALYPGYQIEFICEDQEVEIYGDQDQLVRVMNNLINNAIQAIPEEREPELHVRMEQKEKEVLISISDNGCGIAEEQGERIFEPRFTTKTNGMGLGLAMVKNIIEGFGGRVWYNSNLGVGSTFYFTLPLSEH
ncbi:sensor histidine kinase [Owenweeksia hongkongensis]|uniref:sensor histidine kinase n=1 Tax=Owenweeksia hongkongensis TaxID=253245 RepID=UPI003A94B36D